MLCCLAARLEIEVSWDTMVGNCQNYSGSSGPVGVEEMMSSLVSQWDLAEKRVRLLTPTRPAPTVTLWLLEAMARFLWTMLHENSLCFWLVTCTLNRLTPRTFL